MRRSICPTRKPKTWFRKKMKVVSAGSDEQPHGLSRRYKENTLLPKKKKLQIRRLDQKGGFKERKHSENLSEPKCCLSVKTRCLYTVAPLFMRPLHLPHVYASPKELISSKLNVQSDVEESMSHEGLPCHLVPFLWFVCRRAFSARSPPRHTGGTRQGFDRWLALILGLRFLQLLFFVFSWLRSQAI